MNRHFNLFNNIFTMASIFFRIQRTQIRLKIYAGPNMNYLPLEVIISENQTRLYSPGPSMEIIKYQTIMSADTGERYQGYLAVLFNNDRKHSYFSSCFYASRKINRKHIVAASSYRPSVHFFVQSISPKPFVQFL